MIHLKKSYHEKILPFLLLACIFVTSCKKNETITKVEKNELVFKASGNYKPSDAELQTIQTNLKKLAGLSQKEQNVAILAFGTNASKSSKAKTIGLDDIRITTMGDGDVDYSAYTALVISPTNQLESPDGSEYVMSTAMGTVFKYKWIVAYNAFGFFIVQSTENCELLYYGSNQPLINQYGINSITHAGSYLTGLTGPISWAETSNFNYFSPGLYHAFFNTEGTLTVAGTGAIAVSNSRYANTAAIAGNALY